MIYLKYLWYVIKHKWYVGIECLRRGLYLRAITHDLSKLRPSEFVPYARYFYGKYPSINDVHGDSRNISRLYKETVDSNFDLAWKLHQNRNSHHWQYYVLIEDSGLEKVLPMKHVDKVEMLCDWIGTYRAFPKIMKDAETWYLTRGNEMRLHKYTREFLEAELGKG